MLPAPALTLRDLTIRYGDRVAVAGVSFTVAPGEAFGLLGPNGSGKSTTLAAIAGERVPHQGEVRIGSLRERDDPLEYRRRIGLVPQELAFYDELSAAENLRFFGRLYGLAGERLQRRIVEVLALACLGDAAQQPARTLSGGMQRRLNLACALLHEPTLLLLDEPTVGLDLPARAAIVASLERLRDAGTAIVLTTHHMSEVEQLCDRVGIIDRGRLVALGTFEEVLQSGPAVRPSLPPVVRVDSAHPWPARHHRSVRRGSNLEDLFLQLTGRGHQS